MPPVSRGWKAVDAALSSPVPGDVSSALEALGVEVSHLAGDEVLGHCPGHLENTGKEDRNPSWSCNIDTGAHNCFGCEFGGSFVSLVSYVLEVPRDQAVVWIRSKGSIESVRRRLSRREQAEKRPEINEAALALMVPPPRWALESRLLATRSCAHYGVLWDSEREMWITPIRDPATGRLLGYQEKNERWFRNKPRDVRKARTLFGWQQFTGGLAILVESPLDAVRLHTAGVEGGLSPYGAKVSGVQMELIVSRADHLVLALDDDRDGRAMSAKLLDEYGHRIHTRLFKYPSGSGEPIKDPGEMSRSQIHTALQAAVPALRARRLLR